MKFYDPRMLLTLIVLFTAGYLVGGFNASRQYKAQIRSDNQAAQTKLEQANRRLRDLEKAGGQIVDNQVMALKQELKNAKAEHKRFVDGVRRGAIRVSVPLAPGPAATGADPAAAGRSVETRAELDPEAAATLDAIVGDGDDAITTLNACIDIYNGIREQYNVQAE